MAKLSNDELIEAFKELTLIELSDFVKKFEEVFEVTPAAPVAAASSANRGIPPAAGTKIDAEPSALARCSAVRAART